MTNLYNLTIHKIFHLTHHYSNLLRNTLTALKCASAFALYLSSRYNSEAVSHCVISVLFKRPLFTHVH